MKSGQVSWEFRTYLLFPTDPGISMLLRCQGAGRLLPPRSSSFTRTSRSWMGKIQALPRGAAAALESHASARAAAAAVVRAAGLDEFFRQRGMPESQIQSCLADPAGARAGRRRSTKRATRQGVNGTPTFFINGKIVEGAASWAALEPQLRAAIGVR